MENSLLARLPAELRMSIYEYTLIESGGVCLLCKYCTCPRKHEPQQHLSELPTKLALTQTCAQIRHESRSIFFPANTFLFQNDFVCDLDGYFKGALDTLPPDLSRSMRKIRVQLGTPLCFLQNNCPGHAERVVHEGHWEWKLMKLFHSIKIHTEQMPETNILFEARFCFARDFKVQMKMIAFDDSWTPTLEFLNDERHWKAIVDPEKQAARRDVQECTRKRLLRTLTRAMNYTKS